MCEQMHLSPSLSLPLPSLPSLLSAFPPQDYQEPFGAQQFRGWCGGLGQWLVVPPRSRTRAARQLWRGVARRNLGPTGGISGASHPITSSVTVSPDLILGCSYCHGRDSRAGFTLNPEGQYPTPTASPGGGFQLRPRPLFP